MEMERKERRWLRAGLLLLITFWASAVPTMAVVTVPFMLLALLLPRRGILALALAAVALLTTFSLVPAVGGLWWLERGWALLLGGWFLALTLRWPESAFINRALGAISGAVLVAFAFFTGRPSAFRGVDGAITRELQEKADQAIATMEGFASDPEAGPSVVSLAQSFAEAVPMVVEMKSRFYPGLLLIASVTGLGVAWWIYVRVAQGSDRGLGPLRDFRFNDQLVWVAIASVLLVLWGSAGPASEAGANGVLFMSALYAVRGAAVVVFVTGGVSLMGGLFLGLGFWLIPAYIVSAAMFIGLGDTWLDVRARALKAVGRDSE